MEQAGASRYWCHMCSQTVNPIMEIESMKCPICESGFVEETASAPANDQTTPIDLDLDLGVGGPDSDRALSLWAPILLGMMANPIRHRAGRRLEPEDDDHGPNPNDAEQELESLISRRRRSSAAILQLLQGIRAGMLLERDNQEQRDRESDRDGQRMILINPFNQTIIVQGGDPTNRGPLGDYFIGPGLELLIQHLTENDPNRYGTPPARREAVEALNTLKIEEGAVQLQCAVCLDECDVGAEVKEMPCNHKFHSSCIVSWLDLHSSCPVCRYQLDSKLVSEASRSTPHSGGNGDNARRFSLPLLWPFSSLFSSPTSSQPSAGNSSLALPSASSTDAAAAAATSPADDNSV